MKRSVSFSSIITAILLLSMFIVSVSGEVDKTSTVTRVIDGDTFDISTGERIRLADVDLQNTMKVAILKQKVTCQV